MKKIVVLIFIAFIVLSCEKQSPYKNLKDLNQIAEQYVKLALITGKYDTDYVDAYFGPQKIKDIANKEKMTVAQIKSAAVDLISSVNDIDISKFDDLTKKRKIYLARLLQALKTKLEMLEGKTFSFDRESVALYDAVSPIYNIKVYQEVLNQLETMIPGRGNLSKRFEDYRKRFIIPKNKVDTVFKTAIAECRKRTKKHFTLPPAEEFRAEYVKGKPWGAYNWFKGNSFSLIEVNVELPVYIDRIIGLACHEGYPGHHVFHTTIENELYKKHGWVEFSIYPLFSPVSLLSEGLANYGIELTFPQNEKNEFERKFLYPLAGLNPADAENYNRILLMMQKLTFAGNEAARRYLDGNMNKEHTIDWLMTYGLQTQERAERYLKFIEKYRAYVITYNVGEELVKSYIKKQTNGNSNISAKWDLYKKIISGITLPAELK